MGSPTQKLFNRDIILATKKLQRNFQLEVEQARLVGANIKSLKIWIANSM